MKNLKWLSKAHFSIQILIIQYLYRAGGAHLCTFMIGTPWVPFVQERDGLSAHTLDFREESLTGRCDLERLVEPFIFIASTLWNLLPQAFWWFDASAHWLADLCHPPMAAKASTVQTAHPTLLQGSIRCQESEEIKTRAKEPYLSRQ